MSTIREASPDDILRWPDGTTCYRSQWQIGHYACMSDDFEVITPDNPEYAIIEAGGTGPGASFMAPDSLDTSEREAREP